MIEEPNRQAEAFPIKIGDQARRISRLLDEPNTHLVQMVLDVLGSDRTEAFLEQALAMQAAGGLTTRDDARLRTPGGVFFKLIKDSITPEERKLIFRRMAKLQRNSGAPKAPAPPRATPAVPPPPRRETSWEQALEVVAWGVQLDPTEKGEAKVVKLTIIGRPKGIKQMDGCVAVALAAKGPPALPKGLPKVADTAGPGTIVVFIASKQWEKVLPFLTEHADDEVIVEGYPLFDPKGTTTAVLAQQCVTKYQQRQLREQKGPRAEA